jgi:hypothetical protein
MNRVEVAIAARTAGAVIRSNNGVDLNVQEKGSSRTSILTAVDLLS